MKILKPFKGHVASINLITVLVALVLSSLATIWPVSNYIIILGNAAMIKGQWQIVLSVLGYMYCKYVAAFACVGDCQY